MSKESVLSKAGEDGVAGNATVAALAVGIGLALLSLSTAESWS